MGLEHFIERRRHVRAGGLRFVCRGPTLATVHVVLGLYSAEIIAARGEWDSRVNVAEFVNAAIETMAGVGIADGRLLRVLETCVDGDIGDAPPAALVELAKVCAALGDIQRICDAIALPGDDELAGATAGPEDEGPDPQCIAVVHIAMRHACSPTTVVNWPYEAFQEALEVYQASVKSNGEGGKPSGDVSSVPGIGVSDARDWGR